MKPAEQYRAARRNAARGTVWTGIAAQYEPKGHSGKLYKPNGQREMCRRLYQDHARVLKAMDEMGL